DEALDLIHDMAEDVVAIGECGLDYYKNHATKTEQDRALRGQIEIALEFNLPLVFHVRDAWEDFFAVINDYPKLRGVIHSFTGHDAEVAKALEQGRLLFGLNGIMTFTKDEAQLTAVRHMPLDKILLETDAPYLAPHPHRGKRNEPSYIPDIVEFLARLRGEQFADLARQTTTNAIELFGLDL
nr:TatD family hydrolase [Candidatus Saccharibacteria bacterium]